ncbi:MAG: hypothetical protein ABR598_03175 [Candidatus Dormibacteria bacterium]
MGARLGSAVRNRWYIGLLLFAAGLRLWHFSTPPDDAHEWRQTQTLMNAASYAHGAGWLTPRVDWYGPTPRIGVLEFPVYSILAHLLTYLTANLLTGARIVSWLAGMGAILVFDRILLLRAHPRRRAATVLFALAPIAIFYGHAAQPESLLLFLTLLAAYSALQARTGAWHWSVTAAASLAVAATIKPTALLVLGPPLLYEGWRSRRMTRVYPVLLCAGVAVLLWAQFDRAVLLSSAPDWYRTNTRSEWLFGPLSLRTDVAFYRTLADRAVWTLLTPLTAGLLLSGAARRGDPWWWLWALGGLISIEVFSTLNYVHFYYQLPIIPALAALAAYALPRWPRPAALRLAIAGALAAVTIYAIIPLYREAPIFHDAGTALRGIATPGRPVIVLSSVGGPSPWFPAVLYYAGHPGWNLPAGAAPAVIDGLPGTPACEMVVVYDGGQSPVPDGWTPVAATSEYALGRRLSCR